MWSTPMREVDPLSLLFIDFYVPVLTPHLAGIKTTLQLSENIALNALSHRDRCHQQRGLDKHQVFEGYHLSRYYCRTYGNYIRRGLDCQLDLLDYKSVTHLQPTITASSYIAWERTQ
jgi:hypothetical protein